MSHLYIVFLLGNNRPNIIFTVKKGRVRSSGAEIDLREDLTFSAPALNLLLTKMQR